MPSSARPITVILTANQAKRFVLLLEALPSGIDVTAPSPQHLSILSEARKKFRVKQLNKIYLKGGAEFSPSPVEPLDDDVREVWVSKGEPFVGKAGPAPGSKRAGARVDIIAEESYVDPEAVRQLKRVAELEGAQAAIGMPDLHPGNRFPIGCAVAVRGIYPALIGTDVGCGIALYRLASVPGRIVPANIADQLKGLDDPWDGDVRAWLAERGIDRESKFDVSSLGTVGAGNHFAEICIVESIKNEVKCEELGVKTGDMYLLVHTGSRGLGKSILEACSQSSANPFYPTGTNELAEYLAEHDYAVQWARANRDLVAHRLAACLGLDEGRSGMPSHPLKLVDVTHKSVTKHMLDVEREDAIHSEELWILLEITSASALMRVTLL